MKPHLKTYRNVKVVSMDTGFYTLNLDSDFEKMEVKDQEFGSAMCLIRKEGGEEEEGAAKKDGEPEKKKTQYIAQYLSTWDGDAAVAFLEQCAAGGDDNYFQLARKPRLQARPSEPKVVKAPPRKKEGGAAEDEVNDGTKKGKEHVGQRPAGMDEEGEVEDDEDWEPQGEEEEIAEDVEL